MISSVDSSEEVDECDIEEVVSCSDCGESAVSVFVSAVLIFNEDLCLGKHCETDEEEL
jgi:hypothetical protein